MRVYKGVLYFAYVEIESTPAASHSLVVAELTTPVNIHAGEVDAAMEPDWIQAAVEGAKDVLFILTEECIIAYTMEVRIKKVIGKVFDTTADAVYCASALATCQLFTPEHCPIEVYYDSRWKIRSINSIND